jgi:hypothetical protein
MLFKYLTFLFISNVIFAQAIGTNETKVTVLSGSHDESCPISVELGLCKVLGPS